jgi:hypothetical protein
MLHGNSGSKDAQKSYRNFTRTEFIYIFASINEKEIKFNSASLLLMIVFKFELVTLAVLSFVVFESD